MSLNAMIRKYNIAQVPISWTGRTWGSSNLRLGEMGRRYLATLLKVVAEKLLIADDLLVERLAASAKRESNLIQQERRLMNLERRLTVLESQPKAERRAPNPISGDAA
jgi:dolichol-phosphate mannosyltransferase